MTRRPRIAVVITALVVVASAANNMGTIHLSRRLTHSCVIVALLALTAPAFSQLTPVQPVAPAQSTGYGKLPLNFEANQGQSDGRVKFLARGQGYGLFLTPTEAVLSLRAQHDEQTNRTSVVRMRLVGANRRPQLTGLDLQPGKSNYFIGNDRAEWRRDVPNYARVKYAQVYPGIDLIYHGNQRQLEYDFVVEPGANPRRIELAFKGVNNLSLDAEGNLVLDTTHGEIVQHKPIVYQDIDGQRKPIESRYVLRGTRRVRFQVARYDTAHPLVIDPVLVYSTYLGGTGADEGSAIAVDANGSAYVTGLTSSVNFPTAGSPFQAAVAAGSYDAFVTKFNPAGTALVYSTYLGGTGLDYGAGIAVDATGNAYITGLTASDNFPTLGPIQADSNGGQGDAFVTKLNPTGSALLYSTYLGGGRYDYGSGIAVDSSGNAFVTGYASSGPQFTNDPTPNFPTTAGAFQEAGGLAGVPDAFVAKLNTAGSALVYSTFLSGNGYDQGNAIVVDASGNAYVTGQTTSPNFPVTAGAFQVAYVGNGFYNAFVTKLNPAGSALVYSTYLGGRNNIPFALGRDIARGIAVDAGGNAYITGETASPDFPTTAGAFQTTFPSSVSAFVTKVNPAGSALVYSTFLGGPCTLEVCFGSSFGRAIALDSSGNAHVTGETDSTNFPTADAIQPAIYDFHYDAFVTKLNATGTAPVYSTYLGGDGNDFGFGIAVDGSGNAYVTGRAVSTNFPTSNPFQAANAGAPGTTDAFVAKISRTVGTSTALISSLNPSPATVSVTFTATVTGVTPTGTVQFKDGGADLGAPVTLAGGAASYMTSALTQGTHSISAVYGGDSNNDPSTSPVLSQIVGLPPFGAPIGLIAAIDNPFPPFYAILTWNAVSGVDHYEVARSSNNGAYATIGSPSGFSYLDFGPLPADTTYLYKVRAVAAGGTMSGYSNVDPATTVFFTDDPLLANSTTVKVIHVNELRTAANAMRAAAGLTPAIFTDPSLSSSITIRAVHMQQIRTALDEARSTLGLPPLVYTEGTVTPAASLIKAAFVQQMRNGTK